MTTINDVRFEVAEVKKEVNHANLFSKYLGKETVAKLETLGEFCIAEHTKAMLAEDWHTGHAYENLFNEVLELISTVRSNDSKASRRQPRGYDRSGVAFY